MDKNERILARADIRFEKTSFSRILTFIFLILVVLSFFGGLLFESTILDVWNNTPEFTFFEFLSPPQDREYHKFVFWFDVFLFDDENDRDFANTSGYRRMIDSNEGNIIGVSILYAILCLTPAFVRAIFKRQCRITALTVTDSLIYGSYNRFLSQKSLQIPIEKLDNLTTLSSIADKLRSGITLEIYSTSGVIKLHFVHNAEKIIAAALHRIEEIREEEKCSAAITQPVQDAVTISVSISSKLKELSDLKETGLITKEEYLKKREEIISKL